jgi:competence protein ComGC
MVYAHQQLGDVKAFAAVEFFLTLLIIEYLFIYLFSYPEHARI